MHWQCQILQRQQFEVDLGKKKQGRREENLSWSSCWSESEMEGMKKKCVYKGDDGGGAHNLNSKFGQ